MPPLGISRTLDGERRTDVDELVAWAALLGVDPVTLLLPRHVGPDDVIEVAPKLQQRARIVWGWMRGRWPLPPDLWPDGHALSFPSTMFAEFTERTRPDFDQPLDDRAVAELVELQQLLESVLGSADGVARWTNVRDTVLRRFRLVAIQLEELFARLDREALAAGAFKFDAEAAQREIRDATGWVRGPAEAQRFREAADKALWADVDPSPHGAATSDPHRARGAATTVPGPGPHGASTTRVVDPFGERDK